MEGPKIISYLVVVISIKKLNKHTRQTCDCRFEFRLARFRKVVGEIFD